MDSSNFEDLYRELRGRVLALAVQMTGDPAAAEDVVQETFLLVHRHLDRFRGEARVSTWVYRIALHVALRERDRRKRRPALSLTRVPENRLAGSNAESPLEQREGSERVLSALSSLPPEHRAVLSLLAIEGLSAQEVAEVLGIPEGTVWSRAHLGRKKLLAALHPPCPAGL